MAALAAQIDHAQVTSLGLAVYIRGAGQLAYRSLFLTLAQQLAVVPGPDQIAIIRLRHTDANWAGDLSELPESCKKEEAKWTSPKDVSRRLSGIVTRLWLESHSDRDLLLTAAAKVVKQNEGTIRAFLER